MTHSLSPSRVVDAARGEMHCHLGQPPCCVENEEAGRNLSSGNNVDGSLFHMFQGTQSLYARSMELAGRLSTAPMDEGYQ